MATRKTPAKRPIPIKAPEPILFPTAKPVPETVTEDIPHPEMPTQMLAYAPVHQLGNAPITISANSNPYPPVTVELRNYIATCIGRTIYKALDTPEAEIITMGQAQFEALCRSILEDDEV